MSIPSGFAVLGWQPFNNRKPKPAELEATEKRRQSVLVTLSVRTRDHILAKLHSQLKLSCSLNALDTFSRSNSHAVSHPLPLDDLRKLAAHLIQKEITDDWKTPSINRPPQEIVFVDPLKLNRSKRMLHIVTETMSARNYDFDVIDQAAPAALTISTQWEKVKRPTDPHMVARPCDQNGHVVINETRAFYSMLMEKIHRSTLLTNLTQKMFENVAISAELAAALEDPLTRYVAFTIALDGDNPNSTRGRTVEPHHVAEAERQLSEPITVDTRTAWLVVNARNQLRARVA